MLHGRPLRVKAIKLLRRQFLHLAAGAAAIPAVSRIARAQTYPTRPVRLVVGFPAGGGTDITARLMGQWLSERLAQPFIIENRPGVLGGQVQVYFAGMPESIEYIRAGKLRALAVTTAVRSDALRDIPTMADFVPGYEVSLWFGIGAPRNTLVEITDKLNKEINAGLADPKLKARFAHLGGTVFPGSPADFGKLMSEEAGKWGKVVKFAGIKAD